ncbi:hypothetical protein AZ20_1111 [Bordetella bronchiseptica E014]|uniref:ORC-CDC6 family AAA ATPase n=1 Tax=Bordetella bronchiseptica TaxID=518 RepID=UPI000460B394|nr:hypothetical protein [Bordetella bronchiseptica]KDC14159.1 hypothetical protein AZ20_1111 [Bordetella bronchiseptica E014]KDD46444.1 hypothetical protein L529_1194 [Bordetella bronchiseptica MBORD901]
MAYNSNPFLERMSERTTSDMEFVRLFSPKILEKLAEDAFEGAVHVFRSAPGAGKTTLLRAFTPSALRAFWNSRARPELAESFQKLVNRGVLTEGDSPQLLGVFLSCASGYADLPSSEGLQQEGLFRALLDCRIVLRTLRSLGALLGLGAPDHLAAIKLNYAAVPSLQGIPVLDTALELASWAEEHEQRVYAQLDAFLGPLSGGLPAHLRFEGVLWLQSIQFQFEGRAVAPQRLLMVDDMHKLRRKQRAMLIDELTVMRPSIPIWLAERTVALGAELLSQGAREGRDLREYNLDKMWSDAKGLTQFISYAQNIVDRRMKNQDVVPVGSFTQCLRDELVSTEVRAQLAEGIQRFRNEVERHQSSQRYMQWLARAEQYTNEPNVESLVELYVTRILLVRDASKRQMSLDLTLTEEELEDRDSSQVRAAAELFMHEELGIPYYFGFDRLCVMATNNVEELLALSAALYVGLQAKQVLRKAELILSAQEQEKLLQDAASRKREFIPKSHTEGTRAQRLLDSIGAFCYDQTFAPNAPYAPGVTGVRLSRPELAKLTAPSKPLGPAGLTLERVLAECAAENLLVQRESQATGSRDSGTIFYLNRSLCVHYGLPLQMGGWRDVSVGELMKWVERRLTPNRKNLEVV